MRLERGPVMVVDLTAMRANFRLLVRLSAGRCAAVVKGDGYGHGMIPSAQALLAAGADLFFAARLDDALRLRECLPAAATVAFLDGARGADMAEAIRAGLAPVINNPGQLEAALAAARRTGTRVRAFVHIDTGLNRLGFAARDMRHLAAAVGDLDVRAYMTHLASADDLDLDLCRRQVTRLRSAVRHLPPAPLSIANSCGLFLSRRLHGAITRPGKAAFGINPLPGDRNPMAQPARVLAPVVQVRDLVKGDPVGYASTWRAPGRRRIAILAIGYSNGYRRSASNAGTVAFDGRMAPVVGRVSMDLTAADVTALPDVGLGSIAEIVGPTISYRSLARSEGTNEHEALIGLGAGCPRIYLDHAPAAAVVEEAA
ncbi:MAG: alanine racemase [Rhodobacteraceae bacterium]|nr:alanine racemase [Paracoccaceae bacterium]